MFTPSVTPDINLVCLREAAQLLLRYVLSHHLRLTLIWLSPAVTYTNNSGILTSAPCRSTELKSFWHYAVSRKLRNVIVISYPVHHKLFELYHHISQVDYLCFLGIFVPNWPMSLPVPLGEVIFLSPLRKHLQDCVRSVEVSMSVTSFRDLEVTCWLRHVARLLSSANSNLQVSCTG